jgi:hypothetical protein
MRSRIRTALLTATAAGATITTLGFLAAGSAGAAVHFTPSGGTPIGTDAACTYSALPSADCGMSGYEASGRDFRFASAEIIVPNQTAVKTTSGTYYVALDDSSTSQYQYVRVGIAPCTVGSTAHLAPAAAVTTCPVSGSGWLAFVATDDGAPSPTVTAYNIGNPSPGDGVFVSVYLTSTGNSVHTVITMPSGTTYNNTVAVSGPVYTDAQAVADYTTAIENGGSSQPAAPGSKTRDMQFMEGRFTTLNGAQGTFSGPWTLNPIEATSNGSLPSAGTLIEQPSYLWTDGNSFQGKFGDAFGEWRFPF